MVIVMENFQIKLVALIFIGVNLSPVTANGNTTIDMSYKYIQLAKRLLPELCPGAKVCLNDSVPITDINFRQGYSSCCTECSCESDCTSNCCFPKEEPEPEFQHSETICVYPVVNVANDQFRLKYYSYKMISSVPENDENRNPSSLECGDVKVAPWGSLLPVYSNKSGVIYKNSQCAEAAGVSDGIMWDSVISCEFKDIETRDAINFFTDLQSEYWSDSCMVQFFYPEEYLDIKPFICFENLISSCPPIDFETPKQLQFLSLSEIREACNSGLVSPYRQVEMYANIYCYVCNGNDLLPSQSCQNGDVFLSIRGAFGRFVGLIDTRGLMSKMKEHNSEKAIAKQAYLMNDKNEPIYSKILYCPSGRIVDKNGKCVFTINKWFLDSLAICIKLTSASFFDINEVRKVLGNVWGPLSELSHKWPKNWIVVSVSYERLSVNKHRHLFVQIVNTNPVTDPDQLLKNIQVLLKFPWTLKLEDEAVLMTAEMMHMLTPFHVSSSQSNETFAAEDKNETGNRAIPKFVYIYEYHLKSYFPMYITPLYYREQIELDYSEFELYHENSALLNKVTNETFLLGDFAIVSNSHGQRVARISLRNSGFSKSVHSDVTSCRYGGIQLIVVMFCQTLLKHNLTYFDFLVVVVLLFFQ